MKHGWPTQSPIARMMPRTRSDVQIEQDKQEARARLWKELGIATLDPEEVDDDWLRQGIINQANKQYGRRGRNG